MLKHLYNLLDSEFPFQAKIRMNEKLVYIEIEETGKKKSSSYLNSNLLNLNQGIKKKTHTFHSQSYNRMCPFVTYAVKLSACSVI